MSLIFQRAVRRELAAAASGVFVALFAVTLSVQAIRLLNDLAAGRIATEAVLAVLGFTLLKYLPPLLTLSLFVAVLMTVSRSYRDSEMMVWMSSGLSLRNWLRPVLVFAAPLVFAIALLSLLLTPWSIDKGAEYRHRLSGREDASKVTPGAFREFSGGERVVFVEQVGESEDKVRNVFASSTRHGRLGVMMAETGHLETADNGDRFMVLSHGRRYEIMPGAPDYREIVFERYALRVEVAEAQQEDTSVRAMSLRTLIDTPAPPFRGELMWRIGVPVSAILLALLAIPLAYVNPRAGRSANLVLALLAYMVYSNMLSVSQAWIANGRVSFAVGLVAVHVLALAVTGLLFYRRLVLRPFWRRG